MNTYNAENQVLNLPDNYKKTQDSNNYKILAIEQSETQTVRKALQDVEAILLLDNATGKTLDLYGARVGQQRGQTTDDQYRILIKAKIKRNLSNGSIPNVIDCIATTFGCDKSEITIAESTDSCNVKIVSLPLTVINTAGFSAEQITALIKSLFPVGVGTENLLYEGTFEFSNSESDYDEDKGFCDVEGGTIGGYLGYLYGDTTEIILPI